MSLFPVVEGTVAIRTQARAFVPAFVRRVETGLLPGAPPWRHHYLVTRAGSDGLAFRAADWPTALNVGLNEVDLAAFSDGRLHYVIRYVRWAAFAVALSAVVGFLFVGSFLVLGLRGYIVRHPRSAVPGLSADQNVAIAWAMVIFWGFAWPWILIALHRRPLRRLMNRLIAEVDAEGLAP